MRSADQTTVLRIILVLFVIYLVLIRFNPLVSIVLFAIAFILDGVDGFLALRETSKGKVTLSMYVTYSLGSKENAKQIKAFKESTAKTAKYGPRLDVAGDRIAEYSFWVLFAVLKIVPLFVLLIIIIRHSIADAFLGEKGTSLKPKTGIAHALYTSSLSRAFANIIKFVTFSYLILVYVSGYSIVVGYALITLLALFIVVRGAAEVYESLKDS